MSRMRLRSFLRRHSESMQTILEDCGLPAAEDTVRTGERYLKALYEMTAGYDEKPSKYSTKFPNNCGAPIVILNDINFTSLCAHHTLPFTGRVGIAYLPGTHIIGLSKLARFVDTHAKRFQVQEDLTRDIAHEVIKQTGSPSVYVVVRGEHSCMKCRGVKKSGSEMVTEYGTGMLETPAQRQEVSALLGKM